MKQIHILAEDFIDNIFFNMENGLLGCPMERALTRAGITMRLASGEIISNWGGAFYFEQVNEAHSRIRRMFEGEEPINSFTIEIGDLKAVVHDCDSHPI